MGDKQLVPENPNPIESLKKTSVGEELIERIKKEEESKKDIVEPIKTDDYASKIQNGVEVVDVKAIPQKKVGIPETKERKRWDQIN